MRKIIKIITYKEHLMENSEIKEITNKNDK